MKLTRCVVAFGLVALAAVACDLNPQPLPPGDQSEGGVLETPGASSGGGAAASSSGGTNTGGGSGSGGGSSGGSSSGSDGGGAIIPTDAGLDADATTESDAATDAEVDATLSDANDD